MSKAGAAGAAYTWLTNVGPANGCTGKPQSCRDPLHRCWCGWSEHAIVGHDERHERLNKARLHDGSGWGDPA